jgi:hypothetical protein
VLENHVRHFPTLKPTPRPLQNQRCLVRLFDIHRCPVGLLALELPPPSLHVQGGVVHLHHLPHMLPYLSPLEAAPRTLQHARRPLLSPMCLSNLVELPISTPAKLSTPLALDLRRGLAPDRTLSNQVRLVPA